jgi:hypothetical protein
MKKRFITGLFLRTAILGLLIFFFSCEPVHPEQETVVEIQSPPINQQQTAVWCWAASMENALATYGVYVSQSDIVMTTYGRVANLPLFNASQAVTGLLNNNFRVAPQGKVIHPFIVAGPPAPSVLVRELGQELSPVLVFYNNPQGGGHVVVCYGAKYTGTAAYPIITEVWIKDPWDAQEKVWGGAQLASLWQSTIFLRVAPLPQSPFFYNGVFYVVTPTYEIVNQTTGMVDGRVWYFNEFNEWHVFDTYGQDRGSIP